MSAARSARAGRSADHVPAARGRERAGGTPEDPLDLRLAVGASAAWLALIAAVPQSPDVVIAAAVSCAGLGAVLLLVLRSRAAPALALVLFAVALVLLPLGLRMQHASAGALYALALRGAAVSLEVEVTGDPRPLAAGGVRGPRVVVETDADSVRLAGRDRTVDGTVVVLADAAGWRDVLPGQRVRVDGSLHPDLDGSALSVTVFERGPPELIGRPPWWQRAAGAVRASLRRASAVLPGQERGLLPGLIDGDITGLDPVLAERFPLAGLTHLVAVSGTNCSIVIGTSVFVAGRLGARRRVRIAVGLAVLVAFVIVARPSPSVLRAAVMSLVALSALASGRPRSAVPILACTVLALLLWDPMLATSASFTMSVLATAALLVLAPGWADRLRARGVPVGLAEAVAVAAAAHLVTAPVVAALSGQVSLVAVPANVLAEPVVAVATVVGFAAALVSPLWLGGGSALAWVAGWPCRWLVAVADFFGGLDGAVLPWPGGVAGGLALAGVVVLVAVVALRAGARRLLCAMAATSLLLLVPVRQVATGWPPTGWVFAACDVGQGDALLLPAGPGSAVEIDAGPDPVAIDRCLRSFGITRIALLVVTHFHLDHVGGLPGVTRGRQVDRVLSSPLGDPASGLALADRVAAHVRGGVVSPPVGTRLDIGDTRLDVLGPAHPFHGTRSDPNNSSLVLRATVRGVRILLPGDAELEEQQSVLDAHADLRADVLKVPHHGSAYSQPAFLAASQARIAVVSVGAHNDYGHPSPVLLRELQLLGMPLLRTDRDGDVAITGSPGHVHAVAHGLQESSAAGRPGADASGRSVPGSVVMPSPGGDSCCCVLTAATSVSGARMSPCRPVLSTSTTSPRCPTRSTCWSATRSCSSTAPSARSPPRAGGPIPTSWRPR